MKLSIFSSCVCVAFILSARGDAAVRVPLLVYNERDVDVYNVTDETESTARYESTTSAEVQDPPAAEEAVVDFEPYQKRTACIARTFFHKGCTLCFCTDRTNVALCWDQSEERCASSRKLMEEQRDAENNDPTGVW